MILKLLIGFEFTIFFHVSVGLFFKVCNEGSNQEDETLELFSSFTSKGTNPNPIIIEDGLKAQNPYKGKG